MAQQAQVIRQNAQTMADLDAKFKELERRTAPPPPDRATTSKAFFDDPVATIRGELERQTKPLIEFKESVERQSQYDRVKAQYKADP